MSDQGPNASLVGQLFDGRYKITSILGVGGMGSAYLALDERLDREVVVKVPLAQFLVLEDFRIRFSHEVRQLTKLEHRSIVKIYDGGDADGLPYMTLQYLAGGSLADRIEKAGGKLELDDVAAWLANVSGALDFIHSEGFLHRDIKPGNILFDKQGHAHVADFGIAKALGDASFTAVTLTGVMVGSPAFMAPEYGDETMGARYDQYALAVAAYQALSGELPYDITRNPIAVLVQKSKQRPKPLQDVAPKLPPAVVDAVMKAISTDPGQRFATCRDFAEALKLGAQQAADTVVMDPTGDWNLKAEEDRLRKAAENARQDEERHREAAEQASREEQRLREAAEHAAREEQKRQLAAAEQAAQEEEKRQREAAEQAAQEEEKRQREAAEQAAQEEEKRQREAAEQAAQEEEKRQRAAEEQAAQEEEKRQRAAAEQAAQEEEKRQREAAEQAAQEEEKRQREAAELAAQEEEKRQREAAELAAQEEEKRQREAAEQAVRERQPVVAQAAPGPDTAWRNDHERLRATAAEAAREERQRQREKAMARRLPRLPRLPPLRKPDKRTVIAASVVLAVLFVALMVSNWGGDSDLASVTGADLGADALPAPAGDEVGSEAPAGTADPTPVSNQGPVAEADQVVTEVGRSVRIEVLGNDRDPDGDATSIDAVTAPMNGTATLNGDGTVTYTPNARFVGVDRFGYTVTDGELSASADVVVNVNEPPTPQPDEPTPQPRVVANQPPLAAADQAETDSGESVRIAVLDNDTDPEGDAPSLVEVTPGANGTTTPNDDGTITYTPNAGFSGADSFRYTVSDGVLTSSGDVEVIVNEAPTPQPVAAANRAPTAVADAAETEAGEALQIAVLDNDADPDGAAPRLSEVTDPANGRAAVNSDGTVTYTPNPGFVGSDRFDYTVTDGELTATAGVTVEVRQPAGAPADVAPAGPVAGGALPAFNAALQDLIQNEVTRQDFVVRQDTAFIPAPDGNSFAIFNFEIASSGLTFGAGGQPAAVSAFGSVLRKDPSQRSGEQFLRALRIGFSVDPGADSAADSGTHSFGMTLTPGEYRLAWGLMDNASERITTTNYEFVVPDFNGAPFGIPSVIVANSVAQQSDAIDLNTIYRGSRVGGLVLATDLDNEFGRGDTLVLLYFVAGITIDPAAEPRLEAEYRILRTDDDVSIARVPTQTLSSIAVEQQIPLRQIGQLEAGRSYTIEIRVRDRVTGDEVVRTMPLNIAAQ